MDKKIPRPVDGGVVTDKGIAIVHAGEPIIPLDRFKEMFGDVEPGKNNIKITINLNIDEKKILELSEKIKQKLIDCYRTKDVPVNYRPS